MTYNREKIARRMANAMWLACDLRILSDDEWKNFCYVRTSTYTTAYAAADEAIAMLLQEKEHEL